VRFEFGGYCLDDQRLTLTGAAGPVHVEPQVFRVLHHLLVNRDRVVSKEELLDQVWGDRFVSESALASRVKALRQALGDSGREQRFIRTAHGRGYQLVADVRLVAEGTRRALVPLRSRPIGRDGDIAAVLERVRAAPLVSIVGAGGVGKTTLALAVAHEVEPELADGAVFVDLAPVPLGDDVARAVAEAAGVESAVARSVDDLAAHLASRQVLLVLDNCEHIVGSAARLVERMLERGPSARILTTSRAPLGLADEHVWPLGPLGAAGPALFVERARAAEPRSTWDAADPRVVELCDRLDGVPLALELAAGQLRRFDLDELARRLESRLTLLARRGSGEDDRHVTMEATIDWSYRLLTPDEQALFRHLSAFPATFDLDLVEGSAPPALDADADALLGELVDKSLVVREPGTGRYRLLETIRSFGRERLRQAGEEPAAVERHRQHVVDRMRSSTRLDRWMSAPLAAACRAGLDDARQAFRASLAGGDAGAAVEIAVGAAFLWRNAIGCTEGNTWVDELLTHDLGDHDRLWVELLRADVGQGRGDHRQMFAAGASARRLAATGVDGAGSCLAAHHGVLEHLTGTEATERLTAALELARQSDDGRLVTLIEAFVAVAAVTDGRHDEARRLVESLDAAASDDCYDRFILHWAGWLLALAEVDAGQARRWIGQQHEFLARTGIIETWLTSLSSALCDILEGSDARTLLGRSLALAEREGYRAEGDCLLALAYAELCAGRDEVAAELTGTAVQGGFNSTAHHVLYRAVIARLLRRRLDATARTAAMARGRGRPAAEVVAAHGIVSDMAEPALHAP
jgi:predicted ATPase/DNA-binding winged helix-turn-helix (wHTH) protein